MNKTLLKKIISVNPRNLWLKIMFVVFVMFVVNISFAEPLLMSFNGGEFGPNVKYKANMPQYGAACSVLENMIVLPQGAAVRRPGTEMVAPMPLEPVCFGEVAYPVLLPLDASEIPAKPTAPTIADGSTPIPDPENLLDTPAQQLQAMSGANSYILTADIDLDGVAWTPIVNFSGTLDGNGHTISNLTHTKTSYTRDILLSEVSIAADRITWNSHGKTTGDSFWFINLAPPAPFAMATEYFFIVVDYRYLRVAASYADAIAGTYIDITVAANCRLSGTSDGIVRNAGLFSDVTGGVQIKDLTVDNFDITGAASYIACIAGRGIDLDGAAFLNVNITNSSVTGTSHIGALAGNLHSPSAGGSGFKVYGCSTENTDVTSSGTNMYIGGLIGYVWPDTDDTAAVEIVECQSTGGTITGGETIGGLVGFTDNAPENADYWTVYHSCYSTNTIVSADTAGGFIGAAGYTKFISCYAAGNLGKTGSNAFAVGGFSGFTVGVDTINCYAAGNIQIDNNAWYVGGFTGKLDCDGTTLRCYATGDISIISNADPVDGIGGFAGMIAGYNDDVYGYIKRCWSEGDITIQGNTEGVANAAGVGGFVGVVFGKIEGFENCYCWGSVTNTDGWEDTDYQAGYGVGGFIGSVDGGSTEDLTSDITIANCYCAQTNTKHGSGLADQITYTAGVSGGFLGVDHDTTAFTFTTTRCFFDSDTCGFTDDDSTAAAHATSWMMTKSNYQAAGWAFSAVDGVKDDIDSIWTMPVQDCYDLTDGSPIRLISFEYSTTDAYALAFGAHCMGVFKDGGQVTN